MQGKVDARGGSFVTTTGAPCGADRVAGESGQEPEFGVVTQFRVMYWSPEWRISWTVLARASIFEWPLD